MRKQQSVYEAIFGASPQATAIFGADEQLRAANAALTSFMDSIPMVLPPDLRLSEFLSAEFWRGPVIPVSGYGPHSSSGIYLVSHPGGRNIELQLQTTEQGDSFVTLSDALEEVADRNRLQDLIATRTRQLIASEERLSLIANEVPAGIAHIDKDFTILYANKRFARAYRITPEQITGQNAYDVLHPDTMEHSSRFFEQARRGMLVDFEMRVKLPGNKFKDVRTLLRPDKPSAGEVIGFYLVSIDVTRRKATMSALMQSQKMDALGRMASGISHDFNNLLTVILGNLLPLSERSDSAAIREEFLEPAISAARRGSALTKRLVSLARREQFDARPTDIGEAIREIYSLLQSSIPSTLKINLTQKAPLSAAFIDRSQFEMSILNLALNARDATDGRGQIDIELEPYVLPAAEAEVSRLAPGNYVKIAFRDDGCGMSPDLAEKIFEPFFTSKTGRGSGLGLSMVYGFVEQSNGAIYVDSTEGSGSEFTILLPSLEIAPEDYVGHVWPETEFCPSDQNERVGALGIALIVEDDVDVRRALCRKVTSVGFTVLEASDAEEALDVIGVVQGITTVISDIDMPGAKNGIDLAHRLSAQRPELKVVLMSGKPKPSDKQVWPVAVPFLAKPFTQDELLSAVGRRSPDTRTRQEIRE
ncbi:PAS domain-containing protein [Celeribacter sp. HF31]|uniref:hybrid sensor histidine kinase/response regulator n=1 Tax=Celeribacter sp. HF31 TaxID=2721558 RepID=UPI0014307C16|nr:ATP-binding protein [Celeribacter sp. HF31]NIY81309.1 PAS domain-containing protein [Celeribacter sp. HF31]